MPTNEPHPPVAPQEEGARQAGEMEALRAQVDELAQRLQQAQDEVAESRDNSFALQVRPCCSKGFQARV